jgi:hypothetical protein
MPETEDQTSPSIETLLPRNFTHVKSPNFRSIYSNQSAFGSTAFDFNMTFGEFKEFNPDTKKVIVEEQARIVMSPLHFKIFAFTCAQQLKLYEDNFGEIRIPTGGGVMAEVGGREVPIPSGLSDEKTSG